MCRLGLGAEGPQSDRLAWQVDRPSKRQVAREKSRGKGPDAAKVVSPVPSPGMVDMAFQASEPSGQARGQASPEATEQGVLAPAD